MTISLSILLFHSFFFKFDYISHMHKWPGAVDAHADVSNLVRDLILAHRIWISNILSWDRKSYLNHAILPRLSREGCTLVVLELTHMVDK